MFRKDQIWLYAFGAVTLLVTAFVYWNYFSPEWKGYQSDFSALVGEKFGTQRAAMIPTGLQQTWAKELGRVDRCTTCHQAMEWKGLESAKNPFRTHPKEILAKHPIQQFGCTI
ncbi:MAG TPA: hypothetical protein VLG74_09295, partial [Blastocatellia bacterium]|nr:hypothetical protein [Blastocatellia bacterium]